MKRRELLKAILALPILPFFLPKPSRASLTGEKPTLLLATMIAGFQYHAGEKSLHALREGQPLRLVREKSNHHDHRAIALYWREQKLGYIPRGDNPILANLMDDGYRPKADIARNAGAAAPWEQGGDRKSGG